MGREMGRALTQGGPWGGKEGHGEGLLPVARPLHRRADEAHAHEEEEEERRYRGEGHGEAIAAAARGRSPSVQGAAPARG